ncbi:MAG: phage tail sheath subtilisin-like domain-containing protein [Acidobacteria bacterium Pan2503]|uniref:Phage tail sheath subtilisin-like domain-containing protein n=1 Tax=Candidatus Acidiferrum panamense TaxID=2741543 RepID=A0A7V8NSJ0_9BACT|nr:phage tail sheath subtilisin-like domain-containing protein [Candidatus Acidoferrum panamensis]
MRPTVCNSWRQFTQFFGNFDSSNPPSPLHLAVYTFFSSGGTSCVAIRMTTSSSPPVAASTVLDDNGTSTQPTLEVVAANPGTWASGSPQNPQGGVYVDVIPGTSSVPGSPGSGGAAGTPGQIQTFTIQVKYGGPYPNNIVETWPNLSMIANSTVYGISNYAPSVVNSPYTGSQYINLVDLFSNNASPLNNPAQVTAQPLSGGLDGNNPASPPAVPPVPGPTDFMNAVQLLDQFPDQPFVLNLCGQWDPNITGGVVKNYAEPRGNIFVILDPPTDAQGHGYLPSPMANWASSLSFRSAVAAVYYPQLVISDPYNSQPGSTRTVPPGGFIAGMYLVTDGGRGVAKAPAGLATSLGGVYGVETSGILTNTDQGNLNNSNVNCLVSVPGYGVVIWGARTLSQFLVTRYVPVSRTLIYLSTEFVALTKFAVFEPNDYVLWGAINSVLSQFLSGFWQSGGLQGMSAADAYYVTCDQTNNTPSSIQQGIVNVEIGVALQYPAEFVVITIGQWAGGQNVAIAAA